MIVDRKLSDHFTLNELTKTNLFLFQEENRNVDLDQIQKLRELAGLLEHVRFVLGVPLKINSGYRCLALNRAIGSKDTSQHVKCEAADFTPVGLNIEESYKKLWADTKDRAPNVGQLIYETANRSYGTTTWIHISLGTPYRSTDECRQILKMEKGIYTRLA